MTPKLGPAGRMARFFIDSKLTPAHHHRLHPSGDCGRHRPSPGRGAPDHRAHDRHLRRRCPAPAPRRWSSGSPGPWKSCSGRSPAWSTSTPPPARACPWPSSGSTWARTRKSPSSGSSPSSWPTIDRIPPGRQPAAHQTPLHRRCARSWP